MKPSTAPQSRGEFSNRADRPAQIQLALLLLRGYKIFVSPYFRGSCRFVPSCADYAAEAIDRHGLLKGCWLSARRLARCHPLARAGYDPVPLRTGQ